MTVYLLPILGFILIGITTFCIVGSYRCGGPFEFAVTLVDTLLGD